MKKVLEDTDVWWFDQEDGYYHCFIRNPQKPKIREVSYSHSTYHQDNDRWLIKYTGPLIGMYKLALQNQLWRLDSTPDTAFMFWRESNGNDLEEKVNNMLNHEWALEHSDVNTHLFYPDEDGGDLKHKIHRMNPEEFSSWIRYLTTHELD